MPRLASSLRLPLTRRFQAAQLVVVNNAAPQLQRMWGNLDSHNSDDVAALTSRAGSFVSASKSTSVRQSLGYYQVLSGTKPPLIHPDEVDVDATLRDPFISYWLALKNGHSEDEALALGSSRIVDVVTNLVVGASRQTGDLYVAKAGLQVDGWERIPESSACDWCEELALDTYASADSADFGHDRCGCTAAPKF